MKSRKVRVNKKNKPVGIDRFLQAFLIKETAVMDDKQKTLHLLYLLDNVNIDLAIILAENMAFN